ncbi:hypothetical protein DV872_18215 [Oceanispirochaeta sp. M1]|nr:hypothetical protein DV872_18215 [Oceanispirochaeta sp. M1]
MNDDEILMDLAERYDRIRIKKRMKDKDIEAKAGVSRQVLYNFRKGKRAITMKSFIRLLRAVDALDHLEELLPEQDEYSPLKNTAPDTAKRVRDRGKRDEPFQWGDES